MKKIKTIYKALIILMIFSACTDENNLSFLDSVPVPSNVSAAYNVTQDNTGVVTISPTAEGATQFDIYFGDDTTNSAKVKAGQSVNHVYLEGTYDVKIIAYNIKGDTAEATQPLVVSFKAPENLVVNITNDEAVSKQVNIKATADFATIFEFYSGESGVDQPVATANIGETISYQYQTPGTYDVKVVAKGAAIETAEYSENFEVTEILQPIQSAPTPPTRNEEDVISIFSDVYTNVTLDELPTTWSSLGSFETITIDNNNVWKLTNLDFLGMVTNYANGIDVSSMEKLHIDYWVPSGTTNELLVKIVNTIDGGEDEESLGTTVSGSWQSIDLDMSGFDGGDLANKNKITQLLIDSDGAAGVVYIDNFYFYKIPAQTGVPILFDDFEGNGNITTWAGDAAGLNTAFANPFIDANNESATVLEYNDTGGQYANIRFDNATNFDLSGGNSIFKLKIYVPSSSISGSQPNQISLKLQDGTAAEPWVLQTEIIKPIALDTWQEVTFDFANDVSVGQPNPVDRTDFNRVVIQVNSENNTDTVIAYIDDFSYGNTIVDTPPFATDDFEGNGTITTWAGDSCGMDNMFANPHIDANNQSATVLEYNDTGGQYANIRFDVTPNFDLTAKAKFTLKIYVPSSSITGSQPNQISLKLQDGTAAEPWVLQTEIIKPLVLDTWQEITFDFANDVSVGQPNPIDRTDFNRVVLQVNSENNTDTVIAYIDDFNYHN
ncbi:hypothetical protein [Tenacibaculum sp. IB213877]|uniref:hypothetical protein n=1 Tax=Tenacibaculum sp. IB213877 TaxID=3097351 RepID=UPI002A5A0061|nr:hypothetical protein [Tenacibaculum sp. IB213877]MDY0779517.1 hypothetical protein [Tenacibaculum sp. IB213877]